MHEEVMEDVAIKLQIGPPAPSSPIHPLDLAKSAVETNDDGHHKKEEGEEPGSEEGTAIDDGHHLGEGERRGVLPQEHGIRCHVCDFTTSVEHEKRGVLVRQHCI
jgi:hypothetical protein